MEVLFQWEGGRGGGKGGVQRKNEEGRGGEDFRRKANFTFSEIYYSFLDSIFIFRVDALISQTNPITFFLSLV